MDGLRHWNLWPPIFYTMVWTIGFFIGIFGFLGNAEGPLKLIVGAFTAYGIFMMNAFIDFWIFLVRNLAFQVRPMVAYVLLTLGAMTIISIVLSYIYVQTGNKYLFAAISIIMILTFFGMECIKANEKNCVTEIRGKDYRSNI